MSHLDAGEPEVGDEGAGKRASHLSLGRAKHHLEGGANGVAPAQLITASYTSELASHVLDLTIQEASEIQRLNRDYGALSIDNIDEDWVSLVEQLRTVVSGSLQISAWLTAMSSAEAMLEDMAIQLGQKGSKIQEALGRRENLDYPQEKLKATLNPAVRDSFLSETRNYRQSLQELIKAYVAAKPFQEALQKQKKQSEKYSVAIQRFVRVSKTCAEMLPESKKPSKHKAKAKSQPSHEMSQVEPQSPLDQPSIISGHLRRRSTFTGGQHSTRSSAPLHIQTNGLSVGVVTSSTSSEKRRRERDELVTSNSGSVKHRREKSDKDTMSKRILEPTDPRDRKLKSRSQTDTNLLTPKSREKEREREREEDGIASNTSSVKKKKKVKKADGDDNPENPSPRRNRGGSLEPADPEENHRSIKRKKKAKAAAEEGRSMVRSNSDELSPKKTATPISHRLSKSVSAHGLYDSLSGSITGDTIKAGAEEAERAERVDKSLKRRKKEKEEKEQGEREKKAKEGGKLTGQRKRLSKDLSAGQLFSAQRRVDITVETRPQGARVPPNLETVTVSPLWGKSLQAINSLKEGDDLNALEVAPAQALPETPGGLGSQDGLNSTVNFFNPLAQGSSGLLQLPAGAPTHKHSSSKEIQPSVVPEPRSTQRLQVGNVIRVSENGEEVAVIEIAGKHNVMTAATAEKLVERLVTEEDQDPAFMRCLLLTHCQYLRRQQLLEKLISLYFIHLGETPSDDQLDYFRKMQPVIQQRVLGAILFWVKEQYLDFHQDSELLELLDEFLAEAAHDRYGAILEKVLQARSHQVSRLTFQLKKEERERAQRLRTVPAAFPSDSSIFLEFDGRAVAVQLTLMNALTYAAITPQDLYQFLLASTQKRHAASNAAAGLADQGPPAQTPYSVEALLEREQRLTTWVALEVCSASKLKTRRLVIHRFIKIAKTCLDNRDFFGAFALTNGLFLPPVRRLKKTWDGVSSSDQKTLQQLSTLMEPQNNMEHYQQALRAAKAPLVPFFPIISRELLRLQEKTEGTVGSGRLVNFAKYRQIYEAIQRSVAYTAEPFPFERVEKISFYMEDRVSHSPKEADLDKMSRELADN